MSRIPMAGSLLVVSPHLDDAVLSCGHVLARHPGAVVCTVLSAPPERNMSTAWDRASGFADAFEAMRARREEDRQALALLGASAVHLPFCDAQYASPPPSDQLQAVLRHTLATVRPDSLLMPLGLFHSDHALVADAVLACLASLAGPGPEAPGDAPPAPPAIYAYEDVPYRMMDGIVEARLRLLAANDWAMERVELASASDDARLGRLKPAAIAAYRSQLRAFGPGGQANLHAAERYWRVRGTAGTVTDGDASRREPEARATSSSLR
ncbi:PIG-L deacetylase family protein [Burkholderia plantarii]|uniref:PIG-L deacetylase family protein n=1 Tax=Burkholderia plantarii TaxID=41899 RepID=UPI0018DC15CC|nr:PIG-L family deacetylase [Burkholderia plantarii]MBI0328326.1 PIG-L family deacetylase [Burkholderia plantarii]